MRLLAQFEDINEAEELAWKFRERGIFTFVSGKGSYHLGSMRAGPRKVCLWVVLEKQFDDAEKLLKNENYTVMQPLSEQEMVLLEKETKKAVSEQASRLYSKVATKIMIALLVSLLAFVGYQVFNTL